MATSISSDSTVLPANRGDALKIIQRTFKSDTVTIPDEEMLRRMVSASVGDDMYKQDQATNALEARVAKLTGKEAAMFVVSGTMANQLAVRSHLKQPPHSVMCDTRGHVYRWEAGGVAFHSQATIIPVLPANGLYITWEDIHPSLVPEGVIHYCPTKLICLENTLHGVITPQEEIISIRENVKGHDIALHCDGARLWDVQAATGLPLEDLCAPFDTISVCMSKGLGAPIGSLLVGTKEVIARARWFRQMFGGGMRQSGCLAAAADYALTRTLPLLPAVHAQAARLAKAFQDLGARLILPTQTGMVFVDTEPLGFTAGQLTQRALDNKSIILGGSRIVLHFQITDEAVDDLIGVVTALKEECAQSRREGQPTAIAGNRPKDLYDVTAL